MSLTLLAAPVIFTLALTSNPPLGVALASPLAATAEPNSPAQSVSEESLVTYLKALPAQRSPGGSAEHIAGLEAAQAWIASTLTDLGYEVHEHTFAWGPRPRRADNPPRQWSNYWIDIRGTASPSEVIIVGAHFDAVPQSPGADDNASGVAAAMELARVLKDAKTERTIRLVFFNCEEVGLVGSRAYVDDIIAPRLESKEETIVGMISLDSIGFFSTEPGSQTWPDRQVPDAVRPFLPSVGDFIVLGGVQADAPFTGPLAQAMLESEPELKILRADLLMPQHIPDMLRSDHAPFLPLGVHAVHFADTANFRTPTYHQPTDTLDTLNMPFYSRLVRALAHGVWKVATPTVPQASRPATD